MLEARQITGEVRVYVAGIPEARPEAGFRHAVGGVPASLCAAAIGTKPLEETTFASRGVEDFEPAARPNSLHVAQHERTRSWRERTIGVRGTSDLRIVLPDATIARARGDVVCTDVGLIPVAPQGVEYARFESAHEEGDEASIFGRLEKAGEELTVAATHVVLGPITELRRRVLVQSLVVAGLLAIAVLSC